MSEGSNDVQQAARLMQGFAEHTGLGSALPEQRYLWTDAFAVCNFVELQQRTGDDKYGELAARLVQRVHLTLGRHREDDTRRGFISGLGDAAGTSHPTRGGLRIGKPLPERAPEDSFDPELEWERDGQYFHYLVKWMQALDRLSQRTGEERFNLWARELGEAAYRGFTVRSSSDLAPHLYWKMSIDLSRPLVSAMGQHDPLDGLLTCETLRVTAASLGTERYGPSLQQAVRDFAMMLEGRDLSTTDPLGLGELLSSAWRAAWLTVSNAPYEELLSRLLAAATLGLGEYERSTPLREPASRRLAFRELGLAIGLSAIPALRLELEGWHGPEAARIRALLEGLRAFAWLGEKIRSFWLDPEHQAASSWLSHRAINEVMLATTLVPEGYLGSPH